MSYPRIGQVVYSSYGYDDSSHVDEMAKRDFLVISVGASNPVVAEVKSRNPNTIIAGYTLFNEVRVADDDTASQWLRDKLDSEEGPGGVGDWWAYNAAGERVNWSGDTYANNEVNLTSYVTPDSDGLRWSEWTADEFHDRWFDGWGFDYFYSDNNFWRPRSAADWDRNGVNNPVADPTTRAEWRNSQVRHYNRAKSHGHAVMLNADNDLSGNVWPQGADQFDQYKNVVHAVYLERPIGKSWSAETGSAGWLGAYNWYREVENNLLSPGHVLFDTFVEEPDDYQTARYGLATVLLRDGYCSITTGHYDSMLWFDEYDLAGTASTKWLGEAIDPPQDSPWSQGVYLRRFENGAVLVNPKGNGDRTVSLPGYRRFVGVQDPTTNNGERTSSVTISNRDGLLLIRDERVMHEIATDLNVQGDVEVQGALTLPGGSVAGRVLSSDSDGAASWQPNNRRIPLNTDIIQPFDFEDIYGATPAAEPAGRFVGTGFLATSSLTVSNFIAVGASSNTDADLLQFGLYEVSSSRAGTLVARSENAASLMTTNAIEVPFDTTGGFPASYNIVEGVHYLVALLQVGGTDNTFQHKHVRTASQQVHNPVYGPNFRRSVLITGQSELPATFAGGSGNSTRYPWISLLP